MRKRSQASIGIDSDVRASRASQTLWATRLHMQESWRRNHLATDKSTTVSSRAHTDHKVITWVLFLEPLEDEVTEPNLGHAAESLNKSRAEALRGHTEVQASDVNPTGE